MRRRGVGKATAKLFAQEEAKVFLISRTQSKLEAVAAGITLEAPSIALFF